MRYALLTERRRKKERKKERRTQEKQDTSVCNGCVTRQLSSEMTGTHPLALSVSKFDVV